MILLKILDWRRRKLGRRRNNISMFRLLRIMSGLKIRMTRMKSNNSKRKKRRKRKRRNQYRSSMFLPTSKTLAKRHPKSPSLLPVRFQIQYKRKEGEREKFNLKMIQVHIRTNFDKRKNILIRKRSRSI